MVFFPSATDLKANFSSAMPNYRIHSAEEKLRSAEHYVGDTVARIVKPGHHIELYSPEYFKYCTYGGILACGPTHASVTPLDLVKTRMQVFSHLYKSDFDAFRTIIRTEGFPSLFTGFGATLIGYSCQGAGKYGLYEIFKWKYTEWLTEEVAANWMTSIYFTASASAEVFADILLCPWEAVKVKTQGAMPPLGLNPFSAMSKVISTSGVSSLFRGLVPLWARQVPYTMVMFGTFENAAIAIYKQLPKPKEQYSRLAQTGVSFVAGYIAGIACALISQPADVMVSKINTDRKAGESMGQAVGRIYGVIGFKGLWSGLGMRIVMVGSLTGMQWLIYDAFKAYVGLPTSG